MNNVNIDNNSIRRTDIQANGDGENDQVTRHENRRNAKLLKVTFGSNEFKFATKKIAQVHLTAFAIRNEEDYKRRCAIINAFPSEIELEVILKGIRRMTPRVAIGALRILEAQQAEAIRELLIAVGGR
ncbi:MAG: hypothetical protein LBI81_00355 [Puniceicoccales bacterium]|jgi:hypothetical protein|nr:hypothetical protein [Puniceicoccales bacterium]